MNKNKYQLVTVINEENCGLTNVTISKPFTSIREVEKLAIEMLSMNDQEDPICCTNSCFSTYYLGKTSSYFINKVDEDGSSESIELSEDLIDLLADHGFEITE